MDRQDCVDHLQLDDDSVCDKKINPVAVIDRQIVVSNGTQYLPAHGQMLLFQFIKETSLIGTLKKPWSNRRVNPHRRSNNRGADVVFRHPPRPLRILSVLCGEALRYSFTAEIRGLLPTAGGGWTPSRHRRAHARSRSSSPRP